MKQRVILLILFLSSHKLYSDLCFTPIEDDITKSGVIFIGKLDTIYKDILFQQLCDARIIANFVVKESFKGFDNYEKVNYISILGTCKGYNVRFHKDSTYIIFGRIINREFVGKHFDPIYWTDDCTNSGLLSQRKELIQVLDSLFNRKSHYGEEGEDYLQIKNDRNNILNKHKKDLEALIQKRLQEQRWRFYNYLKKVLIVAGILVLIVGSILIIRRKAIT